jgi:hypothetical protein
LARAGEVEQMGAFCLVEPQCVRQRVQDAVGGAAEDAVEGVEEKARLLLAQFDAHRALSSDLAHDDARAVA